MLRLWKAAERRRKCRWPPKRDFEIEGGRYSLFSYGKRGENGAAKAPGNGKELR
jgi:hypothetical protein